MKLHPCSLVSGQTNERYVLLLSHKSRLRQRTLWEKADLHFPKESASPESGKCWVCSAFSSVSPTSIHNFALLWMASRTCTPHFFLLILSSNFSQNVIIRVWQFPSKRQRIRAAKQPLHFQPRDCGIRPLACFRTGKKETYSNSKLFGDFKSAGVRAYWQEQPVNFAMTILFCSVWKKRYNDV